MDYACVGYAQALSDERHLIVRHDVDMCLESAVRIAEVENQLEICSHYFVLVGSEFYNLWSPSSQKAMERILTFGHKIGLHFDAARYDNDFDIQNDNAAKECDTLEAITGQAIEIISFHRPSPSVLGSPDPIAGRAHTYQPKYFSAMGYCSDSRGQWHYGHPLEHEAVKNHTALQLLTHPIWWSLAGKTPAEKLKVFLNQRDAVIKRELAENCTVYRNEPSNEKGEKLDGI